MPHAHANLVFAHHSAGKARRDQFGCAHLRLMNNDSTAIKDGIHELVLYNVSRSLCDMGYTVYCKSFVVEKLLGFHGSISNRKTFPVK